VNVKPAMVMVPVLAAVEELAATVYVTFWLPVPEAAPVMTIQLVLLTAFHVEVLDGATMATVPPPPAAVALADVEPSAKVAAGTPAWVTGNARPAIVSEPDRADDAVLAARE